MKPIHLIAFGREKRGPLRKGATRIRFTHHPKQGQNSTKCTPQSCRTCVFVEAGWRYLHTDCTNGGFTYDLAQPGAFLGSD